MTMMLFVVMETHDYHPQPPPFNTIGRRPPPPPPSLSYSLRSVSASPLHPLSPKALYFAHVQLNGTFHRLQDGVNTSGLRSASPFLAMWVRIPTLVYFLCRRSKSDTNSGELFIEVLEMCFSERSCFTEVLVSSSQQNYWANPLALLYVAVESKVG